MNERVNTFICREDVVKAIIAIKTSRERRKISLGLSDIKMMSYAFQNYLGESRPCYNCIRLFHKPRVPFDVAVSTKEEYMDYQLKDNSILQINGTYQNDLYLDGFAQMMKDPSYCYKFYWMEAIVILISEGKTEATFSEIIDEMIARAWYTVEEYYVHLSGIGADGEIRDGLERAVIKLKAITNLPGNASRALVKSELIKHADDLRAEKMQLTHMVPYRALAGFFEKDLKADDWNSIVRIMEYARKMNERKLLPYLFEGGTGLQRTIVFNELWINMIQDNTVAILGWIQYEKLKWLQKNNPDVRSIVHKLESIDDNKKIRKLSQVHKLWDAILDLGPIKDVFNDELITKDFDYDVDHFIPWSFMMNDELWNLMPMDGNLNSSKNNLLPKWDPFFKRFASNQYRLYELIYDKEQIHKLFNACEKDNLHSLWAIRELYHPGHDETEFIKILETNMAAEYKSARLQGYGVWDYDND